METATQQQQPSWFSDVIVTTHAEQRLAERVNADRSVVLHMIGARQGAFIRPFNPDRRLELLYLPETGEFVGVILTRDRVGLITLLTLEQMRCSPEIIEAITLEHWLQAAVRAKADPILALESIGMDAGMVHARPVVEALLPNGKVGRTMIPLELCFPREVGYGREVQPDEDQLEAIKQALKEMLLSGKIVAAKNLMIRSNRGSHYKVNAGIPGLILNEDDFEEAQLRLRWTDNWSPASELSFA